MRSFCSRLHSIPPSPDDYSRLIQRLIYLNASLCLKPCRTISTWYAFLYFSLCTGKREGSEAHLYIHVYHMYTHIYIYVHTALESPCMDLSFCFLLHALYYIQGVNSTVEPSLLWLEENELRFYFHRFPSSSSSSFSSLENVLNWSRSYRKEGEEEEESLASIGFNFNSMPCTWSESSTVVLLASSGRMWHTTGF